MNEPAQAPQLAEPEVVVTRLEDAAEPLAGASDLLRRGIGVGLHPKGELLDERVGLEPIVVHGAGEAGGVVEHALRFGEPPRFDERRAEAREKLRARVVVEREERGGPLEQVDRGRDVAPIERSPTRGIEPLRRFRGEGTLAFAHRPEILLVPVRLLKVEADKLLVLDQPSLRRPFEPVCEALVELAAGFLAEELVCGVPNEAMSEAEGVVIAESATVVVDKLPPLERSENFVEGARVEVVDELGEGTPREDAPLHRRPLNDATLAARKAVDARGEERLDRRRDVELASVFGLHREHLL